MQLLCSTAACPPEVCTAIQEASCLSDAFETQRPLAYHSDAYVSVARVRCTGSEVVLKAYVRDQLSAGARQQVQAEIEIHSGLPQHENIVQFLAAFEDYAHIYLLVEFASGGDLRKHLQGLTSERAVRDFFISPVLQALNILHNKGFSHRDLKPENCLVSGGEGSECTGTVKLADFGLAVCTHMAEDAVPGSAGCGTDADTCSIGCSSVSRSVDSDCSTSTSYSASGAATFTTAGGTPLYAAPEVLRAMFRNHGMQAAVGPKNDVWALGVMALEAITGCHPFSPDHFHYENVLYSIAHCTRVNLPQNLSAEFTDFLEQALARDPSARASTAELLSHPWLSKEYSEEELAKLAEGGRRRFNGLGGSSGARAGGYDASGVASGADYFGGSGGMGYDCWEY